MSLAYWQNYGTESYFCERYAQKQSTEMKWDCYNPAREAQDHKDLMCQDLNLASPVQEASAEQDFSFEY